MTGYNRADKPNSLPVLFYRSVAQVELERMAQEIQRQEQVYHVHEGGLAGWKSHFANFSFNQFTRSAKPFFVEDRCNGCGQCVQNCPASAISLQEGTPI